MNNEQKFLPTFYMSYIMFNERFILLDGLIINTILVNKKWACFLGTQILQYPFAFLVKCVL